MCTQNWGRGCMVRDSFSSTWQGLVTHTRKVKILLFHEPDCMQETPLLAHFLIFSLGAPASVQGGPGLTGLPVNSEPDPPQRPQGFN